MAEKTNLYSLEKAVKDEASFLKFADALLQDWLDECQKEIQNPTPAGSPGANGWQNGDLAGFLEAAIAWATAHPMFRDETNPWKRFAAFLHAGKFYE
jgi:hypothetical protein